MDAVDVLVIGAGPAGSAAALSVLAHQPGASVLIVDRAAPGRDKVCGDGIAPQALDVLARLGVSEVVGAHPRIDWLSLDLGATPTRHLLRRPMRRAAHVVPRAELDRRLLDAACAAGATFVQHRVRAVVSEAERVRVDDRWSARVVIGADGVHSAVRQSLELAPAEHTAVALRGYTPVRHDLADEQRIVLAPGHTLGYAWSFPVGDGLANVGYGQRLGAEPVSRAGLLSALERLLPGVADGGAGWRAAHLPLSSARPRQPDGRVLLVGDAASLVNPLTGEGIYYAVRSGELAGIAAGAPDPGRALRSTLQQDLGAHLRQTALLARFASRPWAVGAALRAARRSGQVFDDLVEVGLADGLLSGRTALAALLGH